MKYKAVIILPTRGRAHRIGPTIEALLALSTTSDIVVAVDSDEAGLYSRWSGVEYNVGAADGAAGMNPKLNAVAVSKMHEYDFILFMADDVVPVTLGWDELLIDAIADIPMGISYPDDGIQGKRLPSNGTCFDARLVRAMGYLSPPELPHLYCDNCWKNIGDGLGSLRYCGEVKVDHRHYSTGRSEWDTTYEITNTLDKCRKAKAVYRQWVIKSLPAILELLRGQKVAKMLP